MDQTHTQTCVVCLLFVHTNAVFLVSFTVACLLHARVKQLPAHSAARRRGTRQADSAAIRFGSHQDAGGSGWLDPWLSQLHATGFNMHLLAGQSPHDDQSSLHPKIPENTTQNASSVTERVRQGARQWERERASANVRVKWCERWEVPYTWRVWCAWENELREMETGRWDAGCIQ